MKIIVLMGSARANGYTASLAESFKKGAESVGHNVEIAAVGSMKIAGCIGCEYCHTVGNGECVIKDDMQKVYAFLQDADMVVFASPVYYWSFSGQMQSALSRFYSIGKPPKAKSYAMLLSSASADVYNAIISQYKDVVSYFGAKDAGIITAYGSERKSETKHQEVFDFAKNL